MNSIAIFCGSALGVSPVYAAIAEKVGQALAARQLTLIYGGGRSGLMGIVADSALAAGGKVIGVIPKQLVDRELAHPGLTELHVVNNMHERKTKMSELADGFIAIPGGVGTLEEIFEQWTWAQLGIHEKPCAFLNAENFYTGLIQFLQYTMDQGFTKERFMDKLIVNADIDQILDVFAGYKPPQAKWGMVDQQDLVK
ncbi:TIGR00730 family Rossman fold protein [Acinetobacter sp. LoGeW2-3]|uniref:LOG family protein n=1 Tax=Acinetobacter sp. LoGeW2-3 TaxID=1808001 RepID=UPI000C058503|nr:TIGR00730 family Rossman fold protein [Acinetobacter sp. LoGeW2-3]ATO21027.1 TIGR00730 family Rossman fold protein [Acinetobacter sp. LoGeW2-3]